MWLTQCDRFCISDLRSRGFFSPLDILRVIFNNIFFFFCRSNVSQLLTFLTDLASQSFSLRNTRGPPMAPRHTVQQIPTVKPTEPNENLDAFQLAPHFPPCPWQMLPGAWRAWNWHTQRRSSRVLRLRTQWQQSPYTLGKSPGLPASLFPCS